MCQNRSSRCKIAAEPLAVGCDDKCARVVESDETVELQRSVNSIAGHLGTLYMGCQNGHVYMREAGGQPVDLYSHAANVCSLDCSDKYVLSGSWDHEAIFYRCSAGGDHAENIAKRSFRHPESVWCVKLLRDTMFITGCADHKIRQFENNVLSSEIAYHQSPVRGLACCGEVIYSVENYGKIHKTTAGGSLLAARDVGTLLYCICRYNELIVAGGEHGYLYVCSEDLEILERLETGCSAVWDAKQSGDSLYVAGSVGRLHVYRMRDDSSMEGMCEAGHEASSASGEHSVSVAPAEGGADAGEAGGNILTGVKYKVEGNKVYIEKNGGWDLIGDTVKKYDHSIPVELGSKSFTLSFNDDDNMHEVASEFIRKNKLDPQFHDDIVDHIQKNFKGAANYKKYDTIDLAGVEKVIGDHPIVSFLESVRDGASYSQFKSDPANVYQLEDVLFARDGAYPEIPLFVVFDILKFLVGAGLRLDLAFLFRSKVVQAKEAKAFVYLMTNPPFNLELLDRRVRRLVDSGLLSSKDTHHYEENKRMKSKAGK